jgi:SHS2 domain-containing protein
MTIAYRFLDDIALADTAFEASGDSPSELFQAASQALIQAMAAAESVNSAWSQIFEKSDPDLPTLLFDWLCEIVYLKDAQGLVFREALTSVKQDPATKIWTLDATLVGEEIDPTKHELRSDVKAVTKHMYEVRQDGTRWTARVVLDV